MRDYKKEFIKTIDEMSKTQDKGETKIMSYAQLLNIYGDICENYYSTKQIKENKIAFNFDPGAKVTIEKLELQMIKDDKVFSDICNNLSKLEGEKARFYYYVQAVEAQIRQNDKFNANEFIRQLNLVCDSCEVRVTTENEPEKKTKKSKKATQEKIAEQIDSIDEEIEEIKTTFAENYITNPHQSEEGIDITKPPMPEITNKDIIGDPKEFVKNNPMTKALEKLTPEACKEECRHAARCPHETCSDKCPNRPDREPIKPAQQNVFYNCPRCETNKGKALVPNNHADLYNKSGLICSECREELEAISKSKLDESAKIFEDLENSKPEVLPKEDKKKQVSEEEALKTINAEATSLYDAIDKFEEYEATKEPEKTINNSYIPDIPEADKQKDAGFAGNPVFVKSISDQFKALSFSAGITAETWGLWVAYLKLTKNEDDVITNATRLLDYISNPSDIQYFAGRFNEELQKAAA